MFLLLCSYLKEKWGWSWLSVFHYYSTRMALSAVTCLLIAIFCCPWFIRRLYAWKVGQPIRKRECPVLGKLHAKKKNTPTMGGLLILFSMLCSLLLWMNLSHRFTLLLLMTTVVLGGLGAYDDYLKLKEKSSKGLSSKKKFCIQSLFALLVVGFLFSFPLPYAWHLYFPFFKEPIFIGNPNHLFSLCLIGGLMVFVIVGTSNAVNLTDGLDGLATGHVVLVSLAFALVAFLSNHREIANYLNIAYIEGSGEIAIYLMALAGAGLGFLWYNGYPAQVFMGDTGSLALGAIIGLSAVLLRREFLLAIIGGVFVVETLAVIIQVLSFRLRGKKVLLCSPLHHHFEYKGWHEMKIVLRFWLIGLFLAIVGIASLKFQ